MGTGEIRVQCDGLFEQLDGFTDIFFLTLTPDEATLQIKLVGFGVLRGPNTAVNRVFFSNIQGNFQGGNNMIGDLLLDVEDVDQFALVSFRPDMPICLCIDQLGSDAYPVAGFTDTAFQDVPDVQFTGYLGHGKAGALVVK